MWHAINLTLWLAMLGATLAPVTTGIARGIAVAGLVAAACWQHAAARGVFRRRRSG